MDFTQLTWGQCLLYVGLIVAAGAAYYFRQKLNINVRRFFFTVVFNKKEADTVLLAIEAKKGAKKYWYINNIITPIGILYFPYLLTLVSKDFGIITFNKTLIQLTLTGAFSMIGINVMRSSLTSVNEAIQKTHITDDELFNGLIKDVESIKSKLRSLILFLTLLGTLAYFIQVANFIDPQNQHIYPYLFAVIIIFLVSIFFGRLISVVQTNFLDDKSIVEAYIASLALNHTAEFNSLKEETKGGLL
jgi:hypothetical protein